MPYKWVVAAVIPKDDATGLSPAYDFSGGATRIGLIMPAAWDAAHLTFQGCTTAGGTFTDLYNEAGASVDLTVTVSKAYSLNTSQPYLAPWRWIKVRSGTTAVPVTQTAARTLYFVFQR